MSNGRGPDFETRMAEDEEVPPPSPFVEQATVTDDSVLPEDEPPFEWFGGGTLNACYNCLDRQVEAGAKNRVAIK